MPHRTRPFPAPGRALACAALVPLLLATAGCQTTYYRTMEAFGVHKREILVDRVEEARDEQTEAKEQFQSALEAFSDVVGFEGGDLEAMYEKLNDEYEASESQAQEVRDRIKAVEDVAEALFDEWEDELDLYTSQELRRSSERTLRDTRRRYEDMIAAMHRAESKMDPVLDRFRDQVLFLKHNLNARAIASLENTVVTLESDVARLVRELEASIAEADAFINEVLSD